MTERQKTAAKTAIRVLIAACIIVICGIAAFSIKRYRDKKNGPWIRDGTVTLEKPVVFSTESGRTCGLCFLVKNSSDEPMEVFVNCPFRDVYGDEVGNFRGHLYYLESGQNEWIYMTPFFLDKDSDDVLIGEDFSRLSIECISLNARPSGAEPFDIDVKTEDTGNGARVGVTNTDEYGGDIFVTCMFLKDGTPVDAADLHFYKKYYDEGNVYTPLDPGKFSGMEEAKTDADYDDMVYYTHAYYTENVEGFDETYRYREP